MKKIMLFILILIMLLTLNGCNSKIDDYKKLPIIIMDANSEPQIVMSVEDFAKLYVGSLEFTTTEKDFKWKIEKRENTSKRIKTNVFYLLSYESKNHYIDFPISIDKTNDLELCIGDAIKADRMDKVSVLLYSPILPVVF